MRYILAVALILGIFSVYAEEDLKIDKQDDGKYITITVKIKKEHTTEETVKKAFDTIREAAYKLVGIPIETESKPSTPIHESKGEPTYQKAILGSITPDGFVVTQDGCKSCKKVYHWESDPDNEVNAPRH